MPMFLKCMVDAFLLVFIDLIFRFQVVKWRGLGNLEDWSFSLPDLIQHKPLLSLADT